MIARKHSLLWLALALVALAPGWLLLGHLVRLHAQESAKAPSHPTAVSLAYPGEKHLAHVRQLTFGGQSAEAYFSADGFGRFSRKSLIKRGAQRPAGS